MDTELEYSFVFSQKSRRTLFFIVNYACKLCTDNKIPLNRVDYITYQISKAIADGKITRSDIEFNNLCGITNIMSIRINESGSVICNR